MSFWLLDSFEFLLSIDIFLHLRMWYCHLQADIFNKVKKELKRFLIPALNRLGVCFF
jgi:hypothetical protein